MPLSVSSQETGTSSAQGIVSYYKQLFEDDYELGVDYDPDRDGLGFAQSMDTPGSGYKDYSIGPTTITSGMKITAILSPDTSLTQTINLIDSTTTTLDIETMYFTEGLDSLEQAIVSAVERGVTVRVIVDESGSDQVHLNAIEDAGASIRVCEPDATAGNYFDTQHNKGIIIDGNKVLIASINWSPNSFLYNREAGIIVENQQVAVYYQQLFDYDWGASVDYNRLSHFTSSEDYRIPEIAGNGNNEMTIGDEKEDLQIPRAAYSYAGNYAAESFEGEMTVTCLAAPDNCFDSVNELLSNAKSSILISVYTLSSPYLMATLIDRIEAGVQVKLLLESAQVSSYEKNYNRWTMANLTTIDHNGYKAQGRWASTDDFDIEHDEDFNYQHCKYCIIDDKTLIISSGNWGKTSCPKPRDYEGDGYANVDGNRDWWFVIYGDGSDAIATADDDAIEINSSNLVYFIFIIGIAGILKRIT